jgi:hypothetical protein
VRVEIIYYGRSDIIVTMRVVKNWSKLLASEQVFALQGELGDSALLLIDGLDLSINQITRVASFV